MAIGLYIWIAVAIANVQLTREGESDILSSSVLFILV